MGFELVLSDSRRTCCFMIPPPLAPWEHGSSAHSYIPPKCCCWEVLTGFSGVLEVPEMEESDQGIFKGPLPGGRTHSALSRP